jgi:hypothetical protein
MPASLQAYSPSAQVKAAAAQVATITGTGSKKSYVLLFRYLKWREFFDEILPRAMSLFATWPQTSCALRRHISYPPCGRKGKKANVRTLYQPHQARRHPALTYGITSIT